LAPNFSTPKNRIMNVKIEQTVHQISDLCWRNRKRLLRDGTRRHVRHHRRKIEYRRGVGTWRGRTMNVSEGRWRTEPAPTFIDRNRGLVGAQNDRSKSSRGRCVARDFVRAGKNCLE